MDQQQREAWERTPIEQWPDDVPPGTTYCDTGAHTWCDNPLCDCECHEHQQFDDDSETWRNYP